MPIFVQLSKSERKKFFKKIKSKIKKSWEKFYPAYEISRSMFFNYLSGRNHIPKKLFLNWKKLINCFSISFIEKEKPKYIEKKISKTITDKKLAEIFGILNGDGHISKISYEVCVVGDIKEEDYSNYLKNLFEQKFKTPFTLRKEKSIFKIRCYSKNLANHLHQKYGLPMGNKLGKLKIPKQILSSNNFLKSYIKGLFDTDGSFYLRRKKDPVIEITSADASFLKEIKDALTFLGFFVSKGNQRIFIYRKDEIIKFFELIKPANSKHLKKYENYLILKRG